MKIENIQDRKWYKNYFLNFFIILCLLQVMDFLTTIYVTDGYDISVENNPLVRYILFKEDGNYLLALLKTGVMMLYFIVAWWWVNHPIMFYKPRPQLAFKILPIIIWCIYSIVVALNLIGIIYLRWAI